MYSDKLKASFQKTLDEIRDAGLYKEERVIISQQAAEIVVQPKAGRPQEVLNFCANNYLGLANNKKLIEDAREGLEQYGFGLASVRFICGTQNIHKTLEAKIAEFFQTSDAILYSSCFDANGGLFEVVLDEESAVISDQLNHASIIDGIRLCKAQKHRYNHMDMKDLERLLQETQSAKRRLIATDGVFSMDGDVAPLEQICDLAEKYEAMVMVDDSHATGFFGPTGRGSVEHCKVMKRVDVITSTLGKALGGAAGGFITGHPEIIALLRQRSRPYLFSNTIAPVIAYTCLHVFEMLSKTTQLRDRLEENTRYFRNTMRERGFNLRPGIHPIVPIMLGDAKLAHDISRDLLSEGIYVIGFSFPVVPKGEARIRVQISAAHTRKHLDKAIDAFTKVGKKYNIVR